ncbi:hypothetical protein FKM82_024442 [Ascaphus truei]
MRRVFSMTAHICDYIPCYSHKTPSYPVPVPVPQHYSHQGFFHSTITVLPSFLSSTTSFIYCSYSCSPPPMLKTHCSLPEGVKIICQLYKSQGFKWLI